MPAVMPGIHDLNSDAWKAWMAGTSPAMTSQELCTGVTLHGTLLALRVPPPGPPEPAVSRVGEFGCSTHHLPADLGAAPPGLGRPSQLGGAPMGAGLSG